MTYTDYELLYAATARCRCGAGLAYPLDTTEALKLRAWVCSTALKDDQADGEHDLYPFADWKIREETSINNAGGHTTRPPGTICRAVGKATCPKCGETWQSEPYDACGRGHHWFSGPCPNCGYAVGSAGVHRGDEGPAIEHRYSNVVLEARP